jgi:hypothetical protein
MAAMLRGAGWSCWCGTAERCSVCMRRCPEAARQVRHLPIVRTEDVVSIPDGEQPGARDRHRRPIWAGRTVVLGTLAMLLVSVVLPMSMPVPAALAQGRCSPRPSFTPQTSVTADGRLRVVVQGGAPPLQSVTINSVNNGGVYLDGQVFPVSLPITMQSTNGAALAFTVARTVANQPITVMMRVVDGCGPGETFVGSGTAPWVPPAPSPTPNCAPRLSATPEVATSGPGRIQVTVRGGTPSLQSATITSVENARLSVNGQSYSGSFPLALYGGNGQPIVFVLEQISSGQGIMAYLELVDGCGSWSTFVGAGLATWNSPASSERQPAPASQPRTPMNQSPRPTVQSPTPTVQPSAPKKKKKSKHRRRKAHDFSVQVQAA